jgi:two-component system sensor histidine kinase FlrB
MQQLQPSGSLGEASFSLSMLKEELADTYQGIEQRIERLNGELAEARNERRSELAEKERLADRLQSLLNALPAAVLVLDGQGRVQELNPAAQALLGASLQGELWRELIDQIFIPQTIPGGDLLLRSGRYVSLSTCPLDSEPGQILMLHDVTDKRQLQQNLEHSRRLADMGRMAASLAHQIRTPLASALLYVSQLNGMKSNSEIQQRFSGKALNSLKSLENLIADMLLFANGGGSHGGQVDAAQLLEQALEPLQNKLTGQGIELVRDIEPGEQRLEVNATMLVSALQNLLTNAIQAMPGGGRLTLSVRRENEMLALGVRDSGSGIDMALQARLFEPFVTTREGGTGLGLAVVRAVAHTMGGNASCESKPGEGSQFVIRLPLARGAEKAQMACDVSS